MANSEIPEDDIQARQALDAAQGYCLLDMVEEAWEEVDRLDPGYDGFRDVIEVKLLLLLKEKRWQEALDHCSRLSDLDPSDGASYIHGAYCLHEMGETDRARAMLDKAPVNLQTDAIYHYNMGCYLAVLGEIDGACMALRTAFTLDSSLRSDAQKDPDLESVAGLVD